MSAAYTLTSSGSGGLRIATLTAGGVTISFQDRALFSLRRLNAIDGMTFDTPASALQGAIVSQSASGFVLTYTDTGVLVLTVTGTVIAGAIVLSAAATPLAGSATHAIDSIAWDVDFADPGLNTIAIVPRYAGDRVVNPAAMPAAKTYSYPGLIQDLDNYAFTNFLHIYSTATKQGLHVSAPSPEASAVRWTISSGGAGRVRVQGRTYPVNNRMAVGSAMTMQGAAPFELRPMVGDYWDGARKYAERCIAIGHIGTRKGKVRARTDIPEQVRGLKLFVALNFPENQQALDAERFARLADDAVVAMNEIAPGPGKAMGLVYHWTNGVIGENLPDIAPARPNSRSLFDRLQQLGMISIAYSLVDNVHPSNPRYPVFVGHFCLDRSQVPLTYSHPSLVAMGPVLNWENPAKSDEHMRFWKDETVKELPNAQGIYLDGFNLVGSLDAHGTDVPSTSRGLGGYTQLAARRSAIETAKRVWRDSQRIGIVTSEHPNDSYMGLLDVNASVALNYLEQFEASASWAPCAIAAMAWSEFMITHPFDVYGAVPSNGWMEPLAWNALFQIHRGSMVGVALRAEQEPIVPKPDSPLYQTAYLAFAWRYWRLLRRLVQIPRYIFTGVRMRSLPGSLERWLLLNDFTWSVIGEVSPYGGTIPVPVLPAGAPRWDSSVWSDPDTGEINIIVGNYGAAPLTVMVSASPAEFPGVFDVGPLDAVMIDPETRVETPAGSAGPGGFEATLTIPGFDVAHLRLTRAGGPVLFFMQQAELNELLFSGSLSVTADVRPQA